MFTYILNTQDREHASSSSLFAGAAYLDCKWPTQPHRDAWSHGLSQGCNKLLAKMTRKDPAIFLQQQWCSKSLPAYWSKPSSLYPSLYQLAGSILFVFVTYIFLLPIYFLIGYTLGSDPTMALKIFQGYQWPPSSQCKCTILSKLCNYYFHWKLVLIISIYVSIFFS